MSPAHILIIEDEHALGTALSFAVRRAGHLPTLVASGTAGLDAWKRGEFHAVVLDIGLPDMSGLAVLEKLRAKDAALPVLVITAHATLDHAISAQKLGATQYLPKPLDLRQFEQALASLLARGVTLLEQPPDPPSVTLIGGAACLQEVFIGIARACAGEVPALITGPSGSGKTLAAQVIHAHGTRSTQALQCIESASLKSVSDLDTALVSPKIKQGTLVLEEITALDDALQTRLAAWLAAPPAPHPRLIATSSHDLRAAVAAGTMRAELFYALAALAVPMPSLHERAGDIPALAAFCLGTRSTTPVQLTPPALASLQAYAWPGNVRELRHVLDFALSVCRGGSIFLSHLPPHVAAAAEPSSHLPSGEIDAALARWLDAQLAANPEQLPAYDDLLERIEATMLRHLLDRHDGKPTHLATSLRMNRATLRQKLRRAGLAGAGDA